MLRIHFTGEDLGRTRMAPGPLPAWETVLSLHRLQRGDGGPQYGRWRRSVRGELPRAFSPLASLVPPRGYFPDFLTPAAPAAGLDEALDLVVSSPREVLRRDLTALAAERRPTRWAQAVGHGDPAALRGLGAALRAYHAAAVAPHWEAVREQVDRDHSRLARALLTEGAEAMLARLPPSMRWRNPVLEVDYPVSQDLRLEGRGLLLVPSFFCLRTGVTLLHNDATPVLVHPVEHFLPDTPRDPDGHRRSLGALLGHTRAAVLEALEEPSTTGELARRVGVLASSASQHTAVLRDTGLVRSVRRGQAVRHSLTPMGIALLRRGGGPPFVPRLGGGAGAPRAAAPPGGGGAPRGWGGPPPGAAGARGGALAR
ncbi:ArsR/SmtB family transcription factor, partial [Streptomyces lasiicapitis]|uniref:ArsR/SmtB family transcription factor n=1 Tax=Streptomyces lasiicapitis TaxID=1923961 RepID=UPI00365F64C8